MAKFVFDLDGTLCDLSHRLHRISGDTKDWDAFHEDVHLDAPIVDNVALCRALLFASCDIEFWTGRMERGREKTREWLRKHVGPLSCECVLKMRKENDFRPDIVVKREFLDENDWPTVVFEDRDRVVDMWREINVTCHHVTKGTY